MTLADKVKIGDYISMTPTSTSYTILKDLTGYDVDQTINPSELNLWRVIRKNSNGTVDAVSEYVSSTKVYFKGKKGYINFIKVLNTIAAQYTNEKSIARTRHIGYSDQTEILINTTALSKVISQWTKSTSVADQWLDCDTSKYLCGADEIKGAGDIGYETDYKLVNEAYGSMKTTNLSRVSTSYWLASRRYFYRDETDWHFGIRKVGEDGNLNREVLIFFNKGTADEMIDRGLAVRPIITFKSTLKIESGSGTSSSPYSLL